MTPRTDRPGEPRRWRLRARGGATKLPDGSVLDGHWDWEVYEPVRGVRVSVCVGHDETVTGYDVGYWAASIARGPLIAGQAATVPEAKRQGLQALVDALQETVRKVAQEATRW